MTLSAAAGIGHVKQGFRRKFVPLPFGKTGRFSTPARGNHN
jgi:hypothetical protein